jgi:hypothetical protein
MVFELPSVPPEGHVAIVTGVDADSVEIIEQNWSKTGVARLPMVAQNGHYTVTRLNTGFTVVGWMRRVPTGFNFAMDSFSVVGNIASNFFADFTRPLTSPPNTSLFFPPGEKPQESGGFLILSDAGAITVSRFGFTLLEEDVFLNIPLVVGRGNSQITASFRHDIPTGGQFYGIGTINSGPSLLESVAIFVATGSDGITRVRVNDQTGTTIASDPVIMSTSREILLRLFVDDTNDQVVPSYSIDNGVTFKPANQFAFFVRNSTIFTRTPFTFSFAQGALRKSP